MAEAASLAPCEAGRLAAELARRTETILDAWHRGDAQDVIAAAVGMRVAAVNGIIWSARQKGDPRAAARYQHTVAKAPKEKRGTARNCLNTTCRKPFVAETKFLRLCPSCRSHA